MVCAGARCRGRLQRQVGICCANSGAGNGGRSGGGASNGGPSSGGEAEYRSAGGRRGFRGTAGDREAVPHGGTGKGEAGFDCSGLIQYAYAQHGISLPRVSTAQASAGREVEKSLGALARGDILTFASQPGGSKVSHVGLYLGQGRFIHSSSSKGVMESTLSGTDPNGQWWFVRWVGARRVIEVQ